MTKKADLHELSAAATAGPWYVESEKTDGTYGAGEDCSEGYDVSTICTEAERPYGMPGVLFESHNSTVGLIEEESDEDRFHAWDAVSKANAEFVVAIVNAYRSGHLVEASAPNPDLGAQGEPVWVKKYKAECQRSGADFDAEACITENFPQIVTPQQPAAQGELVGREAVLAVVRAAWALVDNTGHHDLLPLAINRDDWNDLAARLAALKALLPAEELPADAPHAVVYFWPASSSIGTESAPDPGAQGEPVAWAYEELRTRTFDEWEPALSYDRPGPASWFRNIEPLFKQAPAAPQTGSGVTLEGIARAMARHQIHSNEITFPQHKRLTDEGRKRAEDAGWKQWTGFAGAILTLIAQAPRDGGETRGGATVLNAGATPDHEFKSHPSVFWPAATGEKMFEYRRDDRGGYSVGQTVRLRCYDPATGYVDTPPLDRRISNILHGGEFELPEGFCILSLAPTPPSGVETIRQDNEGATDA